jgi:hypothetical protein
VPLPELPVLSAVADAGDFRSPEEVFEFGITAIIEHVEASIG